MINIIPMNYKELHKMTQTSTFTLNGRNYAVTMRKSTVSDNCYITIEVDNIMLCENRVCTCNEILTNGVVDERDYPEWFYFSYVTSDLYKNFNYNELGKTLFLFYYDGVDE